MPSRDLEELWRKRKHIFFDGGQPYYWLQVTEQIKGQNQAMEVDSEGKTKATEHFKNVSPIKLFKEIEKEFNLVSKSTFRLRDGSFNFKVLKEEAELCKKVCVLTKSLYRCLTTRLKTDAEVRHLVLIPLQALVCLKRRS